MMHPLWQLPLWQTVPAPQTLPQAPQLLGSVVVFVAQRAVPPALQVV